MNQKQIALAQQKMDEAIFYFEKSKFKRLTPSAKIMLNAILMESITTRSSEWQTRGNILLEAYGSEDRIGNLVYESFSAVLNQAWLDQSGDLVTTRDLLSAIQKKWCGVFPIC